MQKYVVKNLADTKKLAEQLASELKGGEVFGLVGDLGAGKTTFTQFFAQTLGIKKAVNSPTFTIVKVYKTQHSTVKNFVHIDAYRLNSSEELQTLGVEEYFDNPGTITIIEWVDRVKKILPKNAIIIHIKTSRNSNSRIVKILHVNK